MPKLLSFASTRHPSRVKKSQFQTKFPVLNLLADIIRSAIAIIPVKNGVFGAKITIPSPTSAFLPEKRRFQIQICRFWTKNGDSRSNIVIFWGKTTILSPRLAFLAQERRFQVQVSRFPAQKWKS
jgi:hypothetical protein